MHVLTAKNIIQYCMLQICPKSAVYALVQSGEIRKIKKKKKKKEWDQDLRKLLFGAINETSCRLVESRLQLQHMKPKSNKIAVRPVYIHI